LREIAERVGIRHSKEVWRSIAARVERRRRGPRGRTDVPTELILELIDVEGLSFQETADEVGMSRSGCGRGT